ncbi:MAG: hypothetical protein NVS9B15_25070 [Acidobacteriaceae bacterium]
MIRVPSFLVLVLACLGAAGNQSQRFEKVGHNLMCTCGCNQVLLECNHVGCPNSDGMRTKLATLVQDGTSDDAIYKEFIADYGNIVVAAPIGSGFNRVAWVAPFAVLFAGVMGVGLVARKWRNTSASGAVAPHLSTAMDEFREQARKDTQE